MTFDLKIYYIFFHNTIERKKLVKKNNESISTETVYDLVRITNFDECH